MSQHKLSLDDESQMLLDHLKKANESVSQAISRILRENAAAKGYGVETVVRIKRLSEPQRTDETSELPSQVEPIT